MTIRRRDLIALAGVAAAFPRMAFAQRAAKIPRVVYLSLSTNSGTIGAFKDGLRDYGYADGNNVAVEFVNAGTVENLPMEAARIAATKPDIVVPEGSAAALAMRDVTTTIPIVFVLVGDPVGVGLVPDLVHPGGNLTGGSGLYYDLPAKQLSILRELVPSLKRMAVLYTPTVAVVRNTEQVRTAAVAAGIEPVLIAFKDGQDITSQFAPVVAAGADAGFVVANQYMDAVDTNNTLHDLLVGAKLPTLAQQIYPGVAHAALGVVAYGASTIAGVREAGSFIDAILKGVRPGDIPVQLPTVFDFEVDVGTAKAIGITVPPSILAQATQVDQ